MKIYRNQNVPKVRHDTPPCLDVVGNTPSEALREHRSSMHPPRTISARCFIVICNKTVTADSQQGEPMLARGTSRWAMLERSRSQLDQLGGNRQDPIAYSFRGRPYRSRTGLPLLSSTARSQRHMPGGTSGINRPAWSRGMRGAGSKAATNGDARKDVVRSPTCSRPLLYWHEAVEGSNKVIIKLNVQTATVTCAMFSPPPDTDFLYPAYLTTPFIGRGALPLKNKHPSINGKQDFHLPDSYFVRRRGVSCPETYWLRNDPPT